MTMAFTKRLGEILSDVGMISSEQLETALKTQQSTGEKLGKTLVKLGYLNEEDIARALEHQLFVPFLDLKHVEIDPHAFSCLPVEIMEEEMILPLKLKDRRLQLAVVDPLNHTILDTIKRITNYDLDIFITTETSLKEALNRFYKVKHEAKKALEEMKDEIQRRAETEKIIKDEIKIKKAEESAHGVIRLVESIISQAIIERASDIHIEPTEENLRVRYRIDGILYNIMTIPKEIQSDIITRIKVISGMDITEHRHPQDGHYELSSMGREVDLRLSCYPGVLGEKIVIRLLDKQNPLIGIDKLHFSPENLETIKKIINLPYGLFLCTGPTGSGKTTTLYSILHELNKTSVNILTIEDPVEYKFPTITQMQVNPKINLNFAEGLRAALRQDPDIILVGEIRDFETLQIAIQASMTGHLVLSTLHTNDCLTAITRMEDLGVKPSLIFGGTVGVMAQRLVRCLCNHCKEPYQIPVTAILKKGFRLFTEGDITLYRPKGCSRCNNRGYIGRMGLHEILVFEDEVIGLFLQKEPLPLIKKFLLNRGMKFLADDGLDKAIQGLTSLEEVIRTVQVKEI